jgi:hypothetical protein
MASYVAKNPKFDAQLTKKPAKLNKQTREDLLATTLFLSLRYDFNF